MNFIITAMQRTNILIVLVLDHGSNTLVHWSLNDKLNDYSNKLIYSNIIATDLFLLIIPMDNPLTFTGELFILTT